MSREEKLKKVAYWITTQGIRNSDLTNHKHIDDVIILINIRNDFWSLMSAEDRGVWSGIWGIVYSKSYSLTQKNLDKLEKIIHNTQYRQQQYAAQRQKIRSMRAA